MKTPGCLTLMLVLAACLSLRGEEPKTNQAAPEPNSADSSQQQRYREFEQRMSGIKLVGKFTVDGKEDKDAAKEEYTIHKVSKLPNGDFWLFQARIKYGSHDVTVPIPLEVKWAGKTPVITLDELTIPGLGTFSSRVVIDQDKYAGTWKHGEVGGHLFGSLQAASVEEK